MAVSIDTQLGVADVYAASLYELARQQGAVDDVLGELRELVRLMKIEPEFDSFMMSSALDDDRRAAGLEKMFRGRLSDLVLNTLQVMCQHGRHEMLRALAKRFAQRKQDAAGQVAVTIRTAVELDSAQRDEVSKIAAKLSGRQPVASFRVEPDLLGGLIIEFEDQRYDNTVRRHLDVAHRALRERSERGLEVSHN